MKRKEKRDLPNDKKAAFSSTGYGIAVSEKS
jgi:hypothetical protein